jgi:hypothetical protein
VAWAVIGERCARVERGCHGAVAVGVRGREFPWVRLGGGALATGAVTLAGAAVALAAPAVTLAGVALALAAAAVTLAGIALTQFGRVR